MIGRLCPRGEAARYRGRDGHRFTSATRLTFAEAEPRENLSLEDARAMIKRYDWSECLENSETDESNKALNALMGFLLDLPLGRKFIVRELVAVAARQNVETCDVAEKEALSVL
jgi:hypothetical protein